MRSTGARLLPEAQARGYRRLGKIPLKTFYDYGRDGVGLSTLAFAQPVYYRPGGLHSYSGLLWMRLQIYF